MWKRGSCLIFAMLLWAGTQAWAQDSTRMSPDRDSTQGSAGTTTTTTTTTTSNGDRSDNYDTRQGYRSNGAGVGFGPILGIYRSNNGDANRLTGGAALRLKLGPALGVEGSIQYREDDMNGVSAKSWPVQVTGLIYPLPIVYGLIGVGWYHTTLDVSTPSASTPAGTLPGVSASTTQTPFGWHFGGGVELPMGGLSLTADLRYVFLNYDWSNFPGTHGTNSNFYIINVGLLFGL